MFEFTLYLKVIEGRIFSMIGFQDCFSSFSRYNVVIMEEQAAIRASHEEVYVFIKKKSFRRQPSSLINVSDEWSTEHNNDNLANSLMWGKNENLRMYFSISSREVFI